MARGATWKNRSLVGSAGGCGGAVRGGGGLSSRRGRGGGFVLRSYALKNGINSIEFSSRYGRLVGGLTQIYPHTKAMSRMQLMMQKTITATSTIFATMEELPDVADAPNAAVLPRMRGHIKLDNVTFTYQSANSKRRSAPRSRYGSLEMEPGKLYAFRRSERRREEHAVLTAAALL